MWPVAPLTFRRVDSTRIHERHCSLTLALTHPDARSCRRSVSTSSCPPLVSSRAGGLGRGPAHGRRRSRGARRRVERRPVAGLVSLVETNTASGAHSSGGRRRPRPARGPGAVVGLTGRPGSASGRRPRLGHRPARRGAGRRARRRPSSPFTAARCSATGCGWRRRDGRRHVHPFHGQPRTPGGLAWPTPQALRVLDAAGCDVVLVETVGVGQSEIEVVALGGHHGRAARRAWATAFRPPRRDLGWPMSSSSTRPTATGRPAPCAISGRHRDGAGDTPAGSRRPVVSPSRYAEQVSNSSSRAGRASRLAGRLPRACPAAARRAAAEIEAAGRAGAQADGRPARDPCAGRPRRGGRARPYRAADACCWGSRGAGRRRGQGRGAWVSAGPGGADGP